MPAIPLYIDVHAANVSFSSAAFHTEDASPCEQGSSSEKSNRCSNMPIIALSLLSRPKCPITAESRAGI